ncbi:MAG: Ig-like domain-containing protein [Prevotella sp.]|jgi:hypothetical protein|nr:Ig-like domain-containing protein [Prevotella sp.]
MKKYIFLILFFIVGISSLFAQKQTTEGTDFWLAFGQNRTQSATSTTLELQIKIVATKKDTITLYFTDSAIPSAKKTQTVYMNAGAVYTKNLDTDEKAAVYSYAGMLTTKQTSYKSLHITSKSPVSVYALNQHTATSEAANVLPVTALGTDYYHLGYKNGTASYANDGLLIVATASGTTNIYDGATTVASLTQGQVLYWAAGNAALEGKRFTSDKKIAYFTSHQCAQVPYGATNADMLFEQMMPVSSWGTRFIVPITTQNTARIKVIASEDGTTITQSSGSIVSGALTLSKGGIVELSTTSACYITSNKPVAVCAYMTSLNSSGIGYGGPSEVWIPPMEQMVEKITIAPFFLIGGSSNISNHYALIITPTANKGNTKYAVGAGAAQFLSGGSWTDLSGYSVYSLPLNDAGYTFENTSGLIVLVYGIGSAESYYYLAGSAAYNIANGFYVNDIYYPDVEGMAFCDGNVRFKTVRDYSNASLLTSSDYLRWYIDGQELTASRNLWNDWTTTLPAGSRAVRLVVNNNATGAVGATFTIDIPDAFINGAVSVMAGGTTTLSPNSGGTWQSSNTAVATVNPANGVVTAVSPGTAYFTFTSANGCDGTTGVLTVTAVPVPSVYMSVNRINHIYH